MHCAKCIFLHPLRRMRLLPWRRIPQVDVRDWPSVANSDAFRCIVRNASSFIRFAECASFRGGGFLKLMSEIGLPWLTLTRSDALCEMHLPSSASPNAPPSVEAVPQVDVRDWPSVANSDAFRCIVQNASSFIRFAECASIRGGGYLKLMSEIGLPWLTLTRSDALCEMHPRTNFDCRTV